LTYLFYSLALLLSNTYTVCMVYHSRTGQAILLSLPKQSHACIKGTE